VATECRGTIAGPRSLLVDRPSAWLQSSKWHPGSFEHRLGRCVYIEPARFVEPSAAGPLTPSAQTIFQHRIYLSQFLPKCYLRGNILERCPAFWLQLATKQATHLSIECDVDKAPLARGTRRTAKLETRLVHDLKSIVSRLLQQLRNFQRVNFYRNKRGSAPLRYQLLHKNRVAALDIAFYVVWNSKLIE